MTRHSRRNNQEEGRAPRRSRSARVDAPAQGYAFAVAEGDRALLRVMTGVIKDGTELFKQFMDNEGFKRWMSDTVFGLGYNRGGASEGASVEFEWNNGLKMNSG